MEFEFSSRHLADLYQKGHSRKYSLPKGLARIFVGRVNRIEAAITINDLRIPPSMRFEKLAGAENRFSIRLNKQNRLEFEIDFEDAERTQGFVTILDVSKHYE
jgi:plasmid maintenance system killer protein